jgi:dolichol-phosphate mannosyltransferase
MKTDKSIANFGIYHSKVIKAFNTMNEVARAFGSLLSYVGFKTTAIEVKHSDRFEGKSSYSIYKLLKLSFDVIISNSNKPLRMAVALGFVMASLSFVIAIYNIIAHQIGFIKLEGFTTTVFSIWFVGGLMLTVSGILGLYIGKIFDQVKGRPIYIVRDEININ